MLLSKLTRALTPISRRNPAKICSIVGHTPVRHGSKKVMYVFSSSFKYQKFRKMAFMYFMIGAIPAAAIIFYTSCIVGEAELYDYDPEVYQPEFYEHFAHPITRFIAKYVMEEPSVSYYKDIYALEFESQQRRIVQLIASVKEIERNMGFRGWQRWEGPIRNEMHKSDIERYLEEHEIPTKVKR